MRIHTVLLAITITATACFDPGSDPDDSAPTETGDPSTTRLDDSHEGWRDPSCWGCHDSGTTHNGDRDPYECVVCHGTNGARPGHTDFTPCGECHVQPHAPSGFPDPLSCQTCHQP